MGLFDGIFGGGGKTQQTVTTNSQNPWVTKAQGRNYDWAKASAMPWLGQTAGGVAGWNDANKTAADWAYQIGNSAMTQQAPGPITAAQAGLAQVGPAAQGTFTSAGPAALGNAMMAQGAQIDTGRIGSLMNPYVDNVLATTMGNMRRERDNSAAGIGARSAAMGAFGGSGEALQRAQLDRSFGENAASTEANLRSNAYNSAMQAAQMEAQMRQQAGLQNAQLGTQASLTNAASQNNMSQFNAGQANNMSLNNAQMTNNMKQFDANAANNWSQFNTGQTNNMNQFNQTFGNTWLNDNQSRQLRGLQSLWGIGESGRQIQQQINDLPWTMLQRVMAATPGGTSTTSTQLAPDNSPSTLQQILGLAAYGIPKFF